MKANTIAARIQDAMDDLDKARAELEAAQAELAEETTEGETE